MICNGNGSFFIIYYHYYEAGERASSHLSVDHLSSQQWMPPRWRCCHSQEFRTIECTRNSMQKWWWWSNFVNLKIFITSCVRSFRFTWSAWHDPSHPVSLVACVVWRMAACIIAKMKSYLFNSHLSEWPFALSEVSCWGCVCVCVRGLAGDNAHVHCTVYNV